MIHRKILILSLIYIWILLCFGLLSFSVRERKEKSSYACCQLRLFLWVPSEILTYIWILPKHKLLLKKNLANVISNSALYSLCVYYSEFRWFITDWWFPHLLIHNRKKILHKENAVRWFFFFLYISRSRDICPPYRFQDVWCKHASRVLERKTIIIFVLRR